MNWKALFAVATLVVLIYSPTWVPAASRTFRMDGRSVLPQNEPQGDGADAAKEATRSPSSAPKVR